MRKVFANTLADLAAQDNRIVLLTGDLGYMALEPFADRFPDRFFNVGVGEQNMIGMATGMAQAGLLPFCYSIVTFATLRPYEFIRNGPVQHKLPVRIVGVGGGVEYGHNGLSHYGLEDIAVMRAQPGLMVVAPSDNPQAGAAIRATYDVPGPVYYRLGKDDNLVIPELEGRFQTGGVQLIGDGADFVFVATGNILSEVLEARQLLEEQGVRSTVAVVSSFNPAPERELAAIFEQFPLAISAESHYITGGLGSLCAEVIADFGLPCRLVRCGAREMPDGITGSQKFLLDKMGLSAVKLAESARSALRSKLG